MQSLPVNLKSLYQNKLGLEGDAVKPMADPVRYSLRFSADSPSLCGYLAGSGDEYLFCLSL